ncbi:MAG: MBL fold metallo-hydrolase [Syntrophomonadaceae bacterium]|nr:MBL fold metallo-hydrolase [Syntrophomonadaceae bacterium]
MKLTEHVCRMGNRHFNFFVVGNREAVIVECGVTGAVASLYRQWQAMDHKPRIHLLLAMHAHFDHVCGIPTLQELFPQAAVAASKPAARVLSKQKILADFFEQDARMVDYLVNEGILDEPVDVPAVRSIEVDRTLVEGQAVEVGDGVSLEIIEAPGHSPCSLAAYLPSDQVMFLSDAGGFQISDTDIFPIFFQSYPLYIETIKRLMGYPTRVLAIPHQRIWSGSEVESFYQRALKSAQDAFEAIRHHIDEGKDEDDLKEELFYRYYRDDLSIYTTENIGLCIDLLIRRVKECL